MVTEKAGFIGEDTGYLMSLVNYAKTLFPGTSNWTEDYFSDSAGVSITFEPIVFSSEDVNLVDQLEGIFVRDWNSKLAIPL